MFSFQNYIYKIRVHRWSLQGQDMDEKEQVAQAKMVSSISSPAPEPTKIVIKEKAQKDQTCGAVVWEPFIIMIIVILVILLFFYVFGHITRWF